MDRRMTAMATNVAKRAADDERDEPLENVEQAIDALIAALATIDDNIDDVKVQGVPEQAARDTVRELLDEALMPYAVDVVQALEVFSG